MRTTKKQSYAGGGRSGADNGRYPYHEGWVRRADLHVAASMSWLAQGAVKIGALRPSRVSLLVRPHGVRTSQAPGQIGLPVEQEPGASAASAAQVLIYTGLLNSFDA